MSCISKRLYVLVKRKGVSIGRCFDVYYGCKKVKIILNAKYSIFAQ
jgi:hypothetical protein